jgi:hypothetical protein
MRRKASIALVDLIEGAAFGHAGGAAALALP